MLKWVAVAAALLVVSSEASAQMKGLSPAEVAGVARTRALDLRITQQPLIEGFQPFAGGMLVSRDVGPNAKVGLGLANMYGRKKSGGDLRTGNGFGRSRKPAVTFVMRF